MQFLYPVESERLNLDGPLKGKTIKPFWCPIRRHLHALMRSVLGSVDKRFGKNEFDYAYATASCRPQPTRTLTRLP